MQLSVGIKSAVASARLWALMLRIRDPSKLYKFWGIRVMNQAHANARAKGGRRLWKQIADAVVLQGVSLRGADIRGVGLFGRIGMHKEKGGPIRVREKNFLTIPIDPAAPAYLPLSISFAYESIRTRNQSSIVKLLKITKRSFIFSLVRQKNINRKVSRRNIRHEKRCGT